MAYLEAYSPDNLIADNNHALATGTVTVLSGEGKLSRGSVLMRDSNNKFVLANDDSNDAALGTAEVILAEDVDASSADTVAEVYVSGDFNADAIIVASGYTLTEADKVNLKNAGIYLKASV